MLIEAPDAEEQPDRLSAEDFRCLQVKAPDAQAGGSLLSAADDCKRSHRGSSAYVLESEGRNGKLGPKPDAEEPPTHYVLFVPVCGNTSKIAR